MINLYLDIKTFKWKNNIVTKKSTQFRLNHIYGGKYVDIYSLVK